MCVCVCVCVCVRALRFMHVCVCRSFVLGTVVTGLIERGTVKVGDEVELIGLRQSVKTVCTGVEMFRKQLDKV